MSSTQDLPSMWEHLGDSLPASLDDLRGPSGGTVTLPPRLGWSGLQTSDLSDRRLRPSMCRIVITTGDRTDFERFLNVSLLRKDWPRQRKMLGRAHREAWESKFPDLTPR